MTLKELYDAIGGDYDQALKVLRVEKLADKHIRKLPDNAIFGAIAAAGEAMDAAQLFESSHAIKGVCGNLGLTRMAALASEISEEFRPGNARTLTDDQVKDKIREIDEAFQNAAAHIREYAAQ